MEKNVDVHEILISIRVKDVTADGAKKIQNVINMAMPTIVGNISDYWSMIRQVQRKTNNGPEFWSDIDMRWNSHPDSSFKLH